MVSAVASGRRGRHLLAAEGEFAVRLTGPDAAPSLALRLPGPSDPAELVDGTVTGLDPLYGNEVCRAATSTTMLVGLRDTVSAGRLLEVLNFGRLNGLRFRMATARPATSRWEGLHDLDRTFGTMSALSTLLCWPGHARSDLTVGAARAATAALQQRRVVGHPQAALALRWVVALAGAFPGDPMVLTPLLLKLRWFEPGQEFLVPTRWPVAMLSGDAIGVCGASSVLVGAGLGAADADPIGFVSGLESRARSWSPHPDDDALVRALLVARRFPHRPFGLPA
jgi:hypothetical protein